MDRIAAVPGLDLGVAYLAPGFDATPWERAELRHSHWFPTAIGAARSPGRAVHPGVVARAWRSRPPHACVVSGWSDPTPLALMAACVARGIPYVLGGESFEETGRSGAGPRLRRAILRRAVGGACAWLPAGRRATEHFVSLGAERARCHAFPTTSDTRALAEAVDELRRQEPGPRRRMGLPDDGVILFVGRLVPDKAPEVLLDAVARLDASGRRVVLLVAGEGPERARLAVHPAAAQARLLGFVQPRGIAELLAASDVLVLPSRYETWGAVVGEALAAGLPVVVSDRVGSAPDYVRDGDVGAVVPVDDAPALAAAIAATLDRPDRRSTLPRRARGRAIELGHGLCVESFLAGLRDAGLPLPPGVGATSVR